MCDERERSVCVCLCVCVCVEESWCGIGEGRGGRRVMHVERDTPLWREVICREGTSRGRAAPWNIEKGATDTGQHVECLLYCVCACRREFGLVGGRRPRQNAEECCGEKVGSSRASGRWSPPLCVLYLSRLYNKMRRAHRPAFFSPFAQNIVHLHAMRCVSHGSRRSLCTHSLSPSRAELGRALRAARLSRHLLARSWRTCDKGEESDSIRAEEARAKGGRV